MIGYDEVFLFFGGCVMGDISVIIQPVTPQSDDDDDDEERRIELDCLKPVTLCLDNGITLPAERN